MELTEAFLAKIAGWEVMKQARVLAERGLVVSSDWSPPTLTGIVQDGSVSYKAGLVIKGTIDIDNLCGCRASRQRGIICAHSVAVGLHKLKGPSDEVVRRDSIGGSHRVRRAEATRGKGSGVPGAATGGSRVRRCDPGQEGEPASIAVILPPNFIRSIEKSRVMVCFQAEWKRGRSPLDTLPLDVPFCFCREDLLLLEHIERVAGGDTPGAVSLGEMEFAELLMRLAGHPRVSLGRSAPMKVSSTPKRISLSATLLKGGEIELRIGANVNPKSLIKGKTLWAFDQEGFERLELPPGLHNVLNEPVRIGRDRVPQFLSQDWTLLGQCCDLSADFRLEDFLMEPLIPEFRLHVVGGLSRLEARLEFAYGDRVIMAGETARTTEFWMADPEAPTRYCARDWKGEQQALEILRRSGFSGPNDRGLLQLFGQNAVLSFFAREYPEIETKWKITLEERLERSASQNLERVEPQLKVTPSGEQWFDLSVAFAAQGGERFSAADIQRLILSGQNHVRLKNGRIGLLDTGAVEELQEVLLDCSPVQDSSGYRIDNVQAAFLDATIRERTPWRIEASGEWKCRALRSSGEVEFKLPSVGEVERLLRSYQKDGLAWLWFLRENNFGGILADEMGLGKTVQALALLNGIRLLRTPPESRPSLVLCPTSLVHNWVDEARKFTPGLRVVAIHGAGRRALFDQISKSDLVITSYALIRRDAENYRNIEFDSVLLDEAQHIKNRRTQNAQAVKSIRSGHRVVLTGTPLENSVLDLWSLFDFLMPGYLGSASDFRERYEIPIVRDKDAKAQSRLARRVRPFLLRRLKRDVAGELPDKIEKVSFCDLSAEQRELYRRVLETGRREILESAGAAGIQKSRMIVLNTLLRLRQICCDVRLLRLEESGGAQTSGKLDLFHELLDEVLDGGHRVLVFSQFVSMLALIRERLDANSVEYCYLDGAVTNRREVVDRFQKRSGIPVFLISLKAGGVGLNLTGADTVIHFDPWWNPAVEDQASDRAHRIGQSRVVTVYKLIARETVEEKILNLQSRKRAVIGGVLENDEQAAEALSWEEIQELLS